ncbi:Mu transposase C-terminal domain-containing protein [Sphingomonas sp. dw_22]|uniref:Mu transposase C-terminal domain-containing protein n=1 Tax=Sphingomonas sp. dw_22 TaxID=2721175 RepID=UPI001BD5A237|nr:Mu transposase C-terminal domain-containing protein [Sphingomonas sp. dw_22]
MEHSKSSSLPAGDSAWSKAAEREPVIRRLAGLERVREEDLRSAMRDLQLGRSQICLLLARYRSNPVASALMPERPGVKPGRSNLPEPVDRLIEEIIDRFYRSRQKPSVAALCGAVMHECKAHGLRSPSRKAISARLARRKLRTLIAAREGRKAADDAFRPVATTYEADYALQVVQIDHTPVDQIVVDDRNRQPLCRPWLTIAIDVASRAVTGFYLTLEHPSAVSVAMALRHAVLPKAAWLSERGISAPWPASGIPDRLHMDNAREFHSRALARGCVEYGIEQQFRPPATPHYGGHIERLIGTMMGEVHLLPGTTFSNVAERGTYDAAANSAMTLTELETWIAIQIVGVYHAGLHRGLGRPPNLAWEHTVAARPRPLRHPPDEHRFLLDFLPFEHRMVRRDGIWLFNIRYWDPVLATWIGERMRMPVKYDPRNLSRIFLQAPDGQHWPIPYADLGRPPITLWEHRQAMMRLREEGRAAVNEHLIFEAVEAQRALVAGAAHRTIKARRAARRSAYALDATTLQFDPQPIDHGSQHEADDLEERDRYLPYPLEEWS